MNHFLYHALRAIRVIPSPQPVTWETVFGSNRYTTTGVSVDEYSALNYSPVWSGVSTLSRDIAKLPLILYKNLPNNGKEPFRNHRLYRVLKDEPNPEMTSFKFRETMQALCLLYGNAYAEIVRNDLGEVAGMYPIIPTRVVPERENPSGRLRYRITNPSGGQTFLKPENIIHLSSLSTDGVIGHSIVTHARESFELGLATEKFGAAFFGNGATFGGIAEYPHVLSPETKKNIREEIQAIHGGVERAHKVLVLAGGGKFTQRGTAPNEAQFIETRKFQINEVSRWLTMPPHKLGDLENAHFTNIEEQEIQYYVGCVSGWLKMWEQELSRKLIPRLEYAQQTIEHNLEGVLRGDSTKRAEFYTKMFNIGAFSINRILQLENQNPIGPQGDVHMVPLNMIPVERYGEWIDAELEAKKAPKQIAAPKPEPEENDNERMEAIRAEIRELMTQTEQHVTRAMQAEAEAATSKADAGEWRAKAEAEMAAASALREQVTQREAELVTLQAERDAEREAKATADAERQQAEQRAQEAEAAKATADAVVAAQAAETQHAAEQVAAAVERATKAETRSQTETDRLTRVVAAHRELIMDVVKRVLRPEIDRARRRQGTPENLRKWAEAFYQTHREACTEALYPAIMTHLAWKRSDENPRTVAEQMAEAHCADSLRQIQAVLDGTEPEDFHPALERMWTRWEQERPAALADKVLTDAVAYLRTYQ